MNPNLLFEFTVSKENQTVHVKRAFAAGLELVWDAWTKAELLDQWWAPKPYYVKTKSMDFRVGGCWLYAMVSPEHVAHYCRADYREINPHQLFSALDAFCDEAGKVSDNMPCTFWVNRFAGENDHTMVDITLHFDQLADLEKYLETGFREGFTMGLENLDKLLSSLTAKNS
ncbi:MAG: SRPBCC domain-containing protein [Flavihumibacter sp.]